MICAWGGAELTKECDCTAGVPAPDVSIIVLIHNALAATRRCVAALRAHTGPSHELILVDNGSAADTVAFLRETAAAHPACRLILSAENLGFAAGNNLGLAAARGRDVVLVNSDVVVTPGWLERLIACADAHPRAGLVGPCTNRISGPQQVANVDYDQDSLAGLDDWAARFAAGQAGQASPHWRAVGFCVLIRRALLETIGGLDPRFGRGNFEDDDYALRARLGGFESWIAGDCFVHHDGGRSFAAAGIDLAASLTANWEIFKAKWGLPATAPYGQPVQIGQYVRRPFEPARDRIPLTNRGRIRAADCGRRGRPGCAGRGSLCGGPLRPRRVRLPHGPRRRPHARAGRQQPRLRVVAARSGGRGPGRAVLDPRPRRVRPGRGVEPRTVPVGARPARRRGATLLGVPGATPGRTGLRRGVADMGWEGRARAREG